MDGESADTMRARADWLDRMNMALAVDLVSAAKAIDECAVRLERLGEDATFVMLIRRTANQYWDRAVACRPTCQPKPKRLTEAA